jgi:hypothetical protein
MAADRRMWDVKDFQLDGVAAYLQRMAHVKPRKAAQETLTQKLLKHLNRPANLYSLVRLLFPAVRGPAIATMQPVSDLVLGPCGQIYTGQCAVQVIASTQSDRSAHQGPHLGGLAFEACSRVCQMPCL